MHPNVDIVVFGAGAMGSFFGGLLSRRNRVTLVCRKEHADAIRRAGLRITGKTSSVAHPDVATSVAGVTSHGVTFMRAGEIRHAGIGETAIGGFAGVGVNDVVRIQDIFDEAGIRTRISADIRRDLWLKAVVNAGINPIAALTRLRNGYLATMPILSAAMTALTAEAAAVARTEGFDISDREAGDLAVKVARRTRDNRASMLQDVERARPTEIDAITGAVLRAAEKHRIPVPLNALMYSLIRGLERSYQVE